MSKVIDNIEDIASIDTHIGLSGVTAYHLLQGNLAVDNYVTTQGFNTTLYTGNSSTQSITTGIDMNTQWGNDASEKFGGLVWLKCRNTAIDHYLFDTVRGTQKGIWTSRTDAEYTYTDALSSFTSTGFSLGANTGINYNTRTMTSWNFQTTHRVSGTTNHGKAYTCHFNPFTGFTIVKYEGSGIAGHEIPHHLGRKLGFATIKNLSVAEHWYIQFNDNNQRGGINSTSSLTGTNIFNIENSSVMTVVDSGSYSNASSNNYILYGWANSYFDKANKLIGNYEVGIYQGTGAAGNKVTTRGKPAWLMIKRLDASGDDWHIYDNQRTNFDAYLKANLSTVESASDAVDISAYGFTHKNTSNALNASGGQYLYMVAYDTNSNGGGSYYPKSTDNAQVQINNALIPLAKGIDSNGIKNEIVVANETITGITLTEGKNYIYRTDSGYGVSKYEPNYLGYNGFGDYYDTKTNKWYKDVALFSDDFSTDTTSNWYDSQNIISIENKKLKLDATGYSNDWISLSRTVLQNKKYMVLFDFTKGTSDVNILYAIGDTLNSYSAVYGAGTSKVGTNSFTLTTNSSSVLTLSLYASVAGSRFYDNIAIIPLNDDGSIDISNATEITESRNYLNHIVHADSTGNPLYVEELPKIEYKDVVKANEYQGKNACTAWVNFNGQTTPPTIYDSYNVSKVIRTATGKFDIYLENNPVVTASVNTNSSWGGGAYGTITQGYMTEANKVYLSSCNFNGVLENSLYCSVQIFGGKNA